MTHRGGDNESFQVDEEQPGGDKSPRDNEGAGTPKLPPIIVKKPDSDGTKPNNGSKKNTLSGFTLVTETRRELLEELDRFRSSRESNPMDKMTRPHFLHPLTPQERQALSQVQYEQEEQLRQELQHQLLEMRKSQEEREALQYRYIVNSLRQDEDYDAMQYQDLLEHEHLQAQSTLSAQQQHQLFRQQLEEHLQQQQQQQQYVCDHQLEEEQTSRMQTSHKDRQRSASESAIRRDDRSSSKSKDGRQRKRRAQTRLSRSTTPTLISADANRDLEHGTESGEGAGNMTYSDHFL